MRSKHCIVVALIAGLAVTMAARAESVEERLHKGVYQEETVGDLEAAMKIYQEIVADAKANRPHVAQAKYRLGMCHVKKGENEKAVATFEELIKEFPGQANLLEQARGQLAALGHVPESEAAAGIGLQETWPFHGLGDLNVLAISRDGRYCAFSDTETGGLMVRDLSTGKDQLLNAEGAYWRWASISPGNKWVAYTEWSGSEGRDLLRVAGIDVARSASSIQTKRKAQLGSSNGLRTANSCWPRSTLVNPAR
ncbi:MAG: tetratricopeptide repeat protein [Planctomycetota bacterium]